VSEEPSKRIDEVHKDHEDVRHLKVIRALREKEGPGGR